jgi:hypothetical protein
MEKRELSLKFFGVFSDTASETSKKRVAHRKESPFRPIVFIPNYHEYIIPMEWVS